MGANLTEYQVPVNADIGAIDVDVNAVYQACGMRVRELPITLDELLVSGIPTGPEDEGRP